MRSRITFLLVLLCSLQSTLLAADPPSPKAPNILFISFDDLNDWVGCLGGHPQSKTPNIDRLAATGMLFTNAHCPAPACNPCRSAIFTGFSPAQSGLYDNRQGMRDIMPDAEILSATFSKAGYYSMGSGKMLHYFIDAGSWDEYYPPQKDENPFPRTLYPKKRPVSLPVGGPWQYGETDWGPLDATDEEFGGDHLVAKYVSKKLGEKSDQPFFLACGFYRPHEPWFVPQKYFDAFPLDEIQLPPGYRENDLDDLPPAGKATGPNRYFKHILKNDQWKQGVQGYLASIHFADTQLGLVLDALEKGPHRDNTIVVAWSDHGWHLGEKQHWQKFTAWRACTRVPLIVRVPKGVPGLAEGTTPGKCAAPVTLLSLGSTLFDLAGLAPHPNHSSPSLTPLLKDPGANWPHAAVTYRNRPNDFGLSDYRWRYIHYANGDEELYDTENDPYEWENLASRPEHGAQLKKLRAKAPKAEDFAPKPLPKVSSLVALKWKPIDADTEIPSSKPDGNKVDIVFLNPTDQNVTLWHVDEQGKKVRTTELATGAEHRQPSKPGEVWLITTKAGTSIGFFQVRDRTARATVGGEKN